MLQVECTCNGEQACAQCWEVNDTQPGHFVVNLATSVMAEPKERLDLDTITSSSITNQLIVPTSIHGADQLRPGMLDVNVAEVAMVRCSALGDAWSADTQCPTEPTPSLQAIPRGHIVGKAPLVEVRKAIGNSSMSQARVQLVLLIMLEHQCTLST